MLESIKNVFVFYQNDMKFILDPEYQMLWSLSNNSESASNYLENKCAILSNYGFFETNSQTIQLLNSSEFDLSHLVINPSMKCNLACWYCYSDQHRKQNVDGLDLEKVKSTIQNALAFKIQTQSTSPLSISMFFTSEITLDFGLFLNIWNYIEGIKTNYEFPIYLFLPPTNLMEIRSDFIEFVENLEHLTVSLDFDNKVQKQKVIQNLKQFSKQVRKHCIVPLNSSNVELFTIYTELMYHFDIVSTRPVRISRTTKHPWTPTTINKFDNEMQLFVSNLLELNDEELLRILLVFGPSDYFVRYFDRIISRKKYTTRCPAGRKAVAINPDFKIYPCSGLTANDQYKYNSFDELTNEESNSLLTANIQSNSACKKCPIRYYCGGPCEDWKNKNNISSIQLANPEECAINLIYFRNAVYLVMKLNERNPKLLEKYVKEKGIENRLTYPINFEDFVLFFS